MDSVSGSVVLVPTFSKGAIVLCDLDGTLAEYSGYCGLCHIGDPIPLMLMRVKAWLAAGVIVKIFTARVGPQTDANEAILVREAIKSWCIKHIGKELPITSSKDYSVVAIFDDRAWRVETNTGRIVGVDL